MGNLIGEGINITFAGNGLNNGNAGAMASATPFTATLDGSGQASITVANANNKTVVCTFQEPSGFQSGIRRINKSSTTTIQLEADIQAGASGKIIGGFYW